MIHATLNLFKEVLESGYYYDYVWLSSEQDYPIKDNQTIFNYLEEHNKASFLSVFKMKNWNVNTLVDTYYI